MQKAAVIDGIFTVKIESKKNESKNRDMNSHDFENVINSRIPGLGFSVNYTNGVTKFREIDAGEDQSKRRSAEEEEPSGNPGSEKKHTEEDEDEKLKVQESLGAESREKWQKEQA